MKTTREKLQDLIEHKRADSQSCRDTARTLMDDARAKLGERVPCTGPDASHLLSEQTKFAQERLESARAYLAEASRLDEAANELLELMRRDGAPKYKPEITPEMFQLLTTHLGPEGHEHAQELVNDVNLEHDLTPFTCASDVEAYFLCVLQNNGLGRPLK